MTRPEQWQGGLLVNVSGMYVALRAIAGAPGKCCGIFNTWLYVGLQEEMGGGVVNGPFSADVIPVH